MRACSTEMSWHTKVARFGSLSLVVRPWRSELHCFIAGPETSPLMFGGGVLLFVDCGWVRASLTQRAQSLSSGTSNLKIGIRYASQSSRGRGMHSPKCLCLSALGRLSGSAGALPSQQRTTPLHCVDEALVQWLPHLAIGFDREFPCNDSRLIFSLFLTAECY